MKKFTGFSLIELMVVIAIIGLIAAFGYPAYTQHIERTKRADGMASLLTAQAAMERFRAVNNTYAGADVNLPFNPNVPSDGTTPYYNIAVSNVSGTTYTLTATPINSMPADDGPLTITHTGVKGWGAKTCWPESGVTC